MGFLSAIATCTCNMFQRVAECLLAIMQCGMKETPVSCLNFEGYVFMPWPTTGTLVKFISKNEVGSRV